MWKLIEELVGYLGWTSLILSVVCVFMGQPVYGIYGVVLALVLLNMEFKDEQGNMEEIVKDI